MAIEYMKYVIKNNEKKNGDISRDERKFMKNFFVIKDYFSNIDEAFTYFFFMELKIKIENMLYYTLLKLNPKISNSSEKTINEIIESNFIKTHLDLKSLYKNYLNEQVTIILGNLSSNWYKCPKGHIYCEEKNNEKTSNKLECPFCFIDKNIEENSLLNQDINALREMKGNEIILFLTSGGGEYNIE